MATRCIILRNNRTLGRKKIKDSDDDFIFEDGTYFVRRERVIIDKSSIRGTPRPTLIYVEGISDPIYLDNFKFKEYYEDVPVKDKNGNIFINVATKKPITHKTLSKTLSDIFIDARAIHHMTDKKILSVLSASEDIGTKDIIILVLLLVGIIIGIIGVFV